MPLTPFSSRKVNDLTPFDISEIFENDPESAVVIDVREPWEYYGDTGHVKNSIHIPLGEIPDRIDSIKAHSGKKIILICNSGERSYYAARYLMDNGLDNVYNANGGIMKWLMSGLDVEYE
jgi:rhodanese-related sulfurtransferase